jgi:RNase P protein component
MQMLLKISKKTDPANVREKIRQITEAFRLEEKPGIHIIIEQDA